MRILYHLTIRPPERPECEAISQEIDALRGHFGGELIYLNPNDRVPVYVPRLFFGLHKLPALRSLDADVSIHHVYNPDPFPYPILRLVQKPVVYSLTGGVAGQVVNTNYFGSLAAVTVTDQGSLEYLRDRGLKNVFLVCPGIDVERFTHSPLPLRSGLRLMVGSAPWVRSQFKTKGIDALLAAAQRLPKLRLVFLWRGVLTEEMERRVIATGLENRVEVVDRIADVNEVLAGVHASVTLAAAPDIVKAYPHSLLESLSAGKPVLVSRAIPMASYVEDKGCGVVVEGVSPSDVIAAIRTLERSYTALQIAAERTRKRDFSQQKMIDSFQQLYDIVIGRR